VEYVLQDLRYAARTFRRAPGFTVLAILTIAVGVGASSAIFSIVNAVLLRPLPFPSAHQLLLVSGADRKTKQLFGDATPANFLDWRARNHSFSAMAAMRSARLTLSSGDHPERLAGAMVSANYFDVLDVKPTLGRAFRQSDEGPGAPRVVVLADGLWRQRFGGRTDAIGRSILINEEPYTIVGVMPPGIDYPEKTQAWVPPHWRVPDDPGIPVTADPSAQRGHGYFQVLARLKPDVSFVRAQADMDAVALAMEHDYPNDNQNAGVSLLTLRDDLVSDVRPTIVLLFVAVGLVLLIATANVSGLLIARATARQQEVAVRVALGATRGRILVQLLTESVLLAAAGGGCGVLLAMWLVAPLVALSPSDLGNVSIDTTVLVYGLLVSTAAGLLFGLAPARQLSQLNVNNDLKQSSRGAVGAAQRRVRSALVAAEIALSLVLLVAAELTIKSFIRLQHVPMGFNPEHVLAISVTPPGERYAKPGKQADFYERTLEALRAVPAVESAGATSRLPLIPGNSTRDLMVPGLPPNTPSSADYRTASPDYFRTMGISLLRGRPLEDSDREDRPLVAIVSASLAQRFWPGRDPIGQHFSIDDPEITVVGVVADVHSASLEAAPQPTVYVPFRQHAFPFMTFVLRTAATPATLSAAVREAIWRVDKDQPVGAVRTMDEALSNSLSRRRFGVTLLAAFGVIAVTLAAVGLYGVLAFIVAQRKREIGVRMALGASPRDVIADVLGHGLKLAVIGIVAGIVLALAATRLLSSLLYGTSTTDVATFAFVALLLIVVATGASLVPAFRASRVDPLIALRED
jgi:putative ABC transport system permease protein